MDISELKRNASNHRHPWETVRAKEIQRLIKKHTLNRKHILDIGSGDGYIVNQLCSNAIGKIYTAIDTAYTNDIVANIRQEYNCTVDYLNKLPHVLQPLADCILLADVLEHCKDDAAVLMELNNPDLLKKNAVILITVPAFNTVFSKHDIILDHHRRYNVKQLRLLCKKTGYTIKESGYFFFSLLVIRIIQLLLEKLKLRKPKKSIDNWNGGGMLSKVICTFLYVDLLMTRSFSKIGIHLPGLSAYCICHPSP